MLNVKRSMANNFERNQVKLMRNIFALVVGNRKSCKLNQRAINQKSEVLKEITLKT